MEWAYVPDVGHGLAAGFGTIDGSTVQVDCGSSSIDLAYSKGLETIRPDAFFLTHFHTDHYKGLFKETESRYRIDEVYIPRMPEFHRREEFLDAVWSMASYTFGDPRTPMQADFIETLSRINTVDFRVKQLSRGDIVTIGGTTMNILWPPREIYREDANQAVETAIETFHEAVEEVEFLAPHLDFVREQELTYRYNRLEDSFEVQAHEHQSEPNDFHHQYDENVDMHDLVTEANEALRKAANHLSLAFHIDNRLLAFGDQYPGEIHEIISTLTDDKLTTFRLLLTPHHGTQWDESLRTIFADLAVSSTGGRLIENVNPNFKSIADRHLLTHFSGDVFIPNWKINPTKIPFRLRF